MLWFLSFFLTIVAACKDRNYTMAVNLCENVFNMSLCSLKRAKSIPAHGDIWWSKKKCGSNRHTMVLKRGWVERETTCMPDAFEGTTLCCDPSCIGKRRLMDEDDQCGWVYCSGPPKPTKKPTPFPTSFPTKKPTPFPTSFPTKKPTPFPTSFPTKKPTPYPTPFPTPQPTPYPTPFPTQQNTPFPTPFPTSFQPTLPSAASLRAQSHGKTVETVLPIVGVVFFFAGGFYCYARRKRRPSETPRPVYYDELKQRLKELFHRNESETTDIGP